MTLRHVRRLFRYWARQPLTHELMAARCGLTDPGPTRAVLPITDEDRAAVDRLSVRMGMA